MACPPELSQREALVRSVLDQFNFDKVHKYMVEVRWRWATGESLGVKQPSVDEIRTEAERICLSAMEWGNYFCACGGLKAQCDFLFREGAWTLMLTMDKTRRQDGIVEKAVARVPGTAV